MTLLFARLGGAGIIRLWRVRYVERGLSPTHHGVIPTTNAQIREADWGIGAYKVDLSRRAHVDHVSSEWFSRSAGERFLSLSELYAVVKKGSRRASY